MFRALQFLSAGIARLTGYVVIVMAVVTIVSLILQVFSRYVLSQTYVWTEELALFLFTWLVLLTATIGVARGSHVRLTLLLDAFPPRGRLFMERLIDFLILLFGAALAYAGVRYVNATLGQVSAAVNYPVVWLHAAAPVSGALIVLHALVRMVAPRQDEPDAGEDAAPPVPDTGP